jgi:hypothetical protein
VLTISEKMADTSGVADAMGVIADIYTDKGEVRTWPNRDTTPYTGVGNQCPHQLPAGTAARSLTPASMPACFTRPLPQNVCSSPTPGHTSHTHTRVKARLCCFLQLDKAAKWYDKYLDEMTK